MLIHLKYLRTISLVFILITGVLGVLPTQNSNGQSFSFPDYISEDQYLPDKIIFKLKESVEPYSEIKYISNDRVLNVLKSISAERAAKLFPDHTPPAKTIHISGQPYSDLSRIYTIRTAPDISIEGAINRLYASGVVEYAEPWYIPELLYEPNDPFIESQYYLATIQAYDAWAIQQGDTNMVIAITDTGIDLLHPDLVEAIAYNWDDPINGEDSDNDGYIDNFHGWDLGSNDNNPQWQVDAHGVHVSGIAAASSDNGTGIAGVGFRSRLLPIKISDEDGRLTRAYEGIVYAADQGAQIINCSWGGPMSAGQFGQEIINYAVLNRDALVVAAAGNSNNQIRIFPASYINALSVAATNSSDIKWGGSSFGQLVDISAPGANIFSTWPNGSYVSSSGTSMAAPVVAGAAALVRAQFPDYNALQIAAQLKVTTDIIDTIAQNEAYQGLLGTGRLNLYRALTETHHPYLMFNQLEHPEEYYQLYNPGETMQVGARFLNLLASTNHITAVLSTASNHVDIISDSSQLGQVDHNEITDNFSNPFVIRISESIPPSHEIAFNISFYGEGGVFAGRQAFSMVFNLDFLDIEANQIRTTINSKGNIGFNYPNFSQGIGLLYANANQNRSLVKSAGVMAGISSSKVVDNVYGPVENSFTNSFYPTTNAYFADNPGMGDIEIRGTFTDSLAGNFRIGLQVHYSIFAFQQAPIDKFLIMEYQFINTSGENLPGFYAAYYADWVIQDIRNHRASFDPENRMGFAFSASGGNFTGIQLLSHEQIRHYAFDNQGFGGSLRINDGFTSFEKYTAMKSNRESAGFFDIDNDISTLVATGPFNFQNEDTLTVAFALIAGDHLNDLQASAQLASSIYNGEFLSAPEVEHKSPFEANVFPNPATEYFTVALKPFAGKTTEISVYDLRAAKVYQNTVSHETSTTHHHNINTKQWKPGQYFIQIRSAGKTETIKWIKK